MANLGEHLTAIFTNAGLDNENPELKSLITKVANVEIADELVSKFNQTHFTLEAAQNNPSIIAAVKGQHYRIEDKHHKEYMAKHGFDETMQAELMAEKSTAKRRELIIDKIAEITEKKTGASQGEKSGLTKQLSELNAELAKIKTSHVPKEALDELDNSYKQKLSDLHYSNLLSSYNYASDLAKEEGFMIPKSKIRNALAENKLRVVFENDKPKLEQEDGSDYFENNVKIDFKTFADKTLAKNKLLAASTPPPTPTPQPRPTPNGKPGLDNSKFMAAIDAMQADQALVNK
jgi:ribosomal protein L12E/L44/L45/RPP1/RPP2